MSLTGCSSTIKSLRQPESCKNQAYVNLGFTDYVNQRYDLKQTPRLGILPFDVPENFALPPTEAANYGMELARKVQSELLGQKVRPIIELFHREKWQGKRQDFMTGNYIATQIARNAGYDLVLVGYLDDIKNAETITVNTKIIDVASNVTIWSARTDVSTIRRKKWYQTITFQSYTPSLFSFAQRTDEMAACIAAEIVREEEID